MRGAFARTVELPSIVNTEQASATFEDGVLTISIPKVAKVQRRNIAID